MSSLTEEIGKLFELHKAGALTAEEFSRAKEAVLQRFATSTTSSAPQPSATTSPASPAPDVHDTSGAEVVPIISADAARSVSHASPTATASSAAFEPVTPPATGLGADEPMDYGEARARFPHLALHDLLSYATDASSDALRCTAALEQLERIVANLVRRPHEAKYRRLRLHNPALANTLFAVPGCTAVLESLGFTRVAAPVANATSSSSSTRVESEEQLVLADNDGGGGEDEACVRRTGVPFAALLDEALAAIAYVRATMADARRRQDAVRQLRRGVVLSIRVERALQARADGRLVPFLVECYANDVAGDELHSALRHLQRLEQVVRKVHEQPHEEAYRRLWLHNPVVFRAFVQQPGGLEALVGLAGGALQDGEGAAGTCIVLAQDGTAPQQGRDGSGNDGEAAGTAGGGVDGVCGQFEHALQAVGEVRRGVEALREERRRAARRAAEEAVRTERRRERRRMMHHHDVEQSRLEAVMNDFTRRARTEARQNDTRSAAAAESDSSEEEARRQGGRRVPIAEALAILLGKSRDKL